MIEALLRDLRQPEYVHTLLNPLPIYGLSIALLALLIGLGLRSSSVRVTALLLIFLCAVSVWPIVYFGEAAEANVVALADDDGRKWLQAHEARAERLQYIFYLLALAALAATIVPRLWPRLGAPLAIAVAVLTACSLGAGASIAYAGGKIRHREFRTVPPPDDAAAPKR